MNNLLLKWGTLKGWDFRGNQKAMELLEEYDQLGVSMSAAMREDSPRQKEIILELIDLCDGEIKIDWGGTVVNKDDAKKYILEYGKDK